MRKNLLKISVLVLLFLTPLFMLSYDDTKDFETAKNLDIFYSLFTEISNSYVDELAPGDIMGRTITEMLKTLDPYTNFIPESDVERYTMMTKGEYGGIGATVAERNNLLMIVDILDNSPAASSGLRVGDFIVEVDGHSIENQPSEESKELLQGQAGTTLRIGILRNGERKSFAIERKKIQLTSVPYYGMISNDFGYVKLNEFSQDCANDVLSACTELTTNKGAKGLVLDLRDNPGGLLIEAIKIVNMFVPKGERIVYTKGQNTTENSKFSTMAEPFNTTIPLVVLVNSHSASASEIVSGALQDLDRAVVIGEQTFGKGLVQTRKELSHNCLLKITTSKYYIPSGRCIQKLDYSHRDAQGNPTIVPDSLQRTFYTRNHRPVKDGGGIIPDVVVAEDTSSALLKTLIKEFVLFDFVNATYSAGDTALIRPKTFKFSDNDYKKFIDFYNTVQNSINSESEKSLKQLAEQAQKEQFNIAIDIQNLQKQIKAQRQAQLQSDKTKISRALEMLIIKHLYNERGLIEHRLNNDPYITTAQEYLQNSDRYKQVLLGKK
ncbi:MAG: S41 family peptidase [Bacteroidales bacterium]|nr:S41 family peptidase [Bacteroidales bacterium]